MGGHILIIPFHFPPIQGSTGAFRSLGWVNWLPELGWRTSVLTVNERAYPAISAANSNLIRPDTKVMRARALDAKRHLSVFGHYWRLTALPDRWWTWVLSGVTKGLHLIRKDRPDVLYTTYPIPSSHVIGFALHKITGIPWIAEFRDPMVEENYPPQGLERKLREYIEKWIFAYAAKVIVVTPGAKELYVAKYGGEENFVVEIQNGFDDLLLHAIDDQHQVKASSDSRSITLLHSGALYEDVRDPVAFIEALSELKERRVIDKLDVKVIFRGAGDEEKYNYLVGELGVGDFVKFKETVPYAVAYREMCEADVLLVMQGKKCNRQIPAKFYEYCALQKPILCLADPDGDTANLYRSLGLGESIALEDKEAMVREIPDFLERHTRNEINLVDRTALEGMTRRARARELASLLNTAIARGSGTG